MSDELPEIFTAPTFDAPETEQAFAASEAAGYRGRAMTETRLAKIRCYLKRTRGVYRHHVARVAEALLAEVERLRAENSNLRALAACSFCPICGEDAPCGKGCRFPEGGNRDD